MGHPVTATDERLLRLGDRDNILVARESIPAGTELLVEGVTAVTDADLHVGFKVAATDLEPGELVLRLGVPIGKTTRGIPRGALVHTHNLASQYLRTHARGEA